MDVAKDEQTDGQESIYGIANTDYDFIAPVISEATSDWSGVKGWMQDAKVADTVSAEVVAKVPMASLSRLNNLIETYGRHMQGVPFYGITTNQKEYCWKRPIAITKRNTHSFKNVSMTDEKVSPTASTMQVVRPLREGTLPGTLPREGNVKERFLTTTQRIIFPALMFNSLWEFFDAKEVHRRIPFKAADHFGVGGNLLPSTMVSTNNSSQKKGPVWTNILIYQHETPPRQPAFLDIIASVHTDHIKDKSVGIYQNILIKSVHPFQ